MKQVVGDADQAAIAFRHQREHGFVRVVEALPGGLRHLIGKRRLALTAVERVVTVPERLPGRQVGLLDRANESDVRHGGVQV